jgi:hypothetical protein
MKLFPGTGGTTDYNSCVKFLRECREQTRTKDKEEKDRLLVDLFKECTSDLSATKLTHNWQLIGGKPVCRGIFAFAYGFSNYELDTCSAKVKANLSMERLRPSPYNDATLHSYNYNETEAMMEENDLDPGNFFVFVFHLEFTFLSIEMVLYAIVVILIFILCYLHR